MFLSWSATETDGHINYNVHMTVEQYPMTKKEHALSKKTERDGTQAERKKTILNKKRLHFTKIKLHYNTIYIVYQNLCHIQKPIQVQSDKRLSNIPPVHVFQNRPSM